MSDFLVSYRSGVHGDGRVVYRRDSMSDDDLILYAPHQIHGMEATRTDAECLLVGVIPKITLEDPVKIILVQGWWYNAGCDTIWNLSNEDNIDLVRLHVTKWKANGLRSNAIMELQRELLDILCKGLDYDPSQRPVAVDMCCALKFST